MQGRQIVIQNSACRQECMSHLLLSLRDLYWSIWKKGIGAILIPLDERIRESMFARSNRSNCLRRKINQPTNRLACRLKVFWPLRFL